MIVVLMSTYNGSLYIRKQIESILSQQNTDVYLLIRDDGSTDNTCDIVNDYIETNSNIHLIKGCNVGFVKSFSSLVNYAYENIDAELYAFVDQDDIWYPNRLARAADDIREIHINSPILHICNFYFIDKEDQKLRIHNRSMVCYKNGNFIYGAQQPGCSMVFNKEALEIYANYNPIGIAYHDTWMFYLCYLKGRVIYCQQPLFGYRLHENNTLGSTVLNPKGSIMNRISNYFTKQYYSYHADCMKEILKKSDMNICPDIQKNIRAYLEYRRSIYYKLLLLTSRDFGPVKRTLKNRFKYIIDVLFNQL